MTTLPRSLQNRCSCTQSEGIRSPGLPVQARQHRIRKYPMTRAIPAVLPLLAACIPAWINPAAGQEPGFALLQIESSARSAALGGSLVAISEDINAFLYNPALLASTEHRRLSVSYTNHLADVSAGFATYARDLPGLGTAAVALRMLSWGRIARTDADGNTDGTFTASDLAATLGFSRAVSGRLRYGANFHFAHSSVDAYRASALAVDVGAAYRIAQQQLTVSAAASHLGLVLQSLGSESDALPFDVRLGVAKKLRHLPLLISLTAYKLSDLHRIDSAADIAQHLVLGTEFQFTRTLHIRFGYNHRRHEALKTSSRLDLAGLGMGFGLAVSRVRLDYAFSSWSVAGLHQFTLQTRI